MTIMASTGKRRVQGRVSHKRNPMVGTQNLECKTELGKNDVKNNENVEI